MKALKALVVAWLAVLLFAAVAVIGSASADAAGACNTTGSHICNGDRYVVIATYRRSSAGISSTVERMGPRRARQAFYNAPGMVCVDTIQRAGGRVVHPGVCHG
jgi:hypothetical protein